MGGCGGGGGIWRERTGEGFGRLAVADGNFVIYFWVECGTYSTVQSAVQVVRKARIAGGSSGHLGWAWYGLYGLW